LPGQLARDVVALRFEQLAEASEDAGAVGDGDSAPGALRFSRQVERALDLSGLAK
jgi:hypothetical protein